MIVSITRFFVINSFVTTTLKTYNSNGLSYLLEVGNTTLLVGESGEEIFEKYVYVSCCICMGVITHSEDINIL